MTSPHVLGVLLPERYGEFYSEVTGYHMPVALLTCAAKPPPFGDPGDLETRT